MRLAALILSTLLLVGACTGPKIGTDARIAPDPDHQVRFAVVGDMPYSDRENAMLTAPDGKIAAAIRAYDPAVLIHVGDLKSGGAACTDALLKARRDQVFDLNPFRTVYTPGDNDLTDCDRDGLTIRFDELERLDFLRNLFYEGDGAKLSRDVPGLTRQAGFVENSMWQIGGLVFGTLHVPGTNNGRDEILRSDPGKALAEADRRDAMNDAWVEKLFERAGSAAALAIAFQADIYHPDTIKSHRECTAQHRTDCDGFKRIRDHIERKAALYEKPVLIIHGDTNAYCFHKPAEGLAINLWRLNAPGDYKLSDAVQITFDPGNTKTPFHVLRMLNPKPLPDICDYSR